MNREAICIKSMDGILLYSFVKRGEKESDKVPYHLPAPPPIDFHQLKERADKDYNTIDIIFSLYSHGIYRRDVSRQGCNLTLAPIASYNDL